MVQEHLASLLGRTLRPLEVVWPLVDFCQETWLQLERPLTWVGSVTQVCPTDFCFPNHVLINCLSSACRY
jgi:hypothetical protein